MERHPMEVPFANKQLDESRTRPQNTQGDRPEWQRVIEEAQTHHRLYSVINNPKYQAFWGTLHLKYLKRYS